jgi:hypothetical protein
MQQVGRKIKYSRHSNHLCRRLVCAYSKVRFTNRDTVKSNKLKILKVIHQHASNFRYGDKHEIAYCNLFLLLEPLLGRLLALGGGREWLGVGEGYYYYLYNYALQPLRLIA